MGMKRGIATFTLDYGKCPPWLFERMVRLGRAMTEVIVAEYGPEEFIKRMADPVWFQSLGTVLAFDWNASGLTTTLTGALKESIRGQEQALGLFICGGKGKTSQKTPDQIAQWGERAALPLRNIDNLIYNSRMSAKVDSSLIQDGYQLYHHTFFFTKSGAWTVVQQGMNTNTKSARRYHWHSEHVTDLVREPHAAIAAQARHGSVLNLTAAQSDETRDLSTDLIQGSYQTLMRDIELLRKHTSELSQMVAFRKDGDELVALDLAHKEFHRHPVMTEDFSKSKYLEKVLQQVTFQKPETYEQFVSLKGVGPKTVRALALVSEVIYGAKPSYEDPARYAFAHGGKDATPFPVDRTTYDKTIRTIQDLVRKTKIEAKEKDRALSALQKKLPS